MQPAGMGIPGHRVRRIADPNELVTRDDPVLLFGELRNPMVTATFSARTADKGEVSGSSPPGNVCSVG